MPIERPYNRDGFWRNRIAGGALAPVALPALALALAVSIQCGPADAQATSIPFGIGFDIDNTTPVEITSETLDVNQSDGSVTFVGDVRISRGNLDFEADRVEVTYAAGRGEILSLAASGSVVITDGADAAESNRADYDVATGKIELSGDVILKMGPAVLSAARAQIDLEKGTANIDGRVRTILLPAEEESGN